MVTVSCSSVTALPMKETGILVTPQASANSLTSKVRHMRESGPITLITARASLITSITSVTRANSRRASKRVSALKSGLMEAHSMAIMLTTREMDTEFKNGPITSHILATTRITSLRALALTGGPMDVSSRVIGSIRRSTASVFRITPMVVAMKDSTSSTRGKVMVFT